MANTDFENWIINDLKELFKKNGIYDDEIFKLKNDKKYYYVNCFNDDRQQGNHISFQAPYGKPKIIIKIAELFEKKYEEKFEEIYLPKIKAELAEQSKQERFELIYENLQRRQYCFSINVDYKSYESKRWAYDSFIIIYNILAKRFEVQEIKPETLRKTTTATSSISIENNSEQEVAESQNEINEIKEFEHSLPENITATTKEQLVKIRIGQSLFRKRLLEKDPRCKICGLNDQDLLIASHIQPWKDSNDCEKLNPYNGFLLCPNHDALFDKVYISFEDNGKILISPNLSDKTLNLFGVSSEIENISIHPENKQFLKWHRDKYHNQINKGI